MVGITTEIALPIPSKIALMAGIALDTKLLILPIVLSNPDIKPSKFISSKPDLNILKKELIAGVDFLLACFEKAFPTIKSVIQTTWNIVKPILEGLGGAIKLVADGVGSVAKFISGKGKKDKVGANATGSSFFSGGYTMVGEHGAELVELPTGSKVHTNSDTKNILGSKGVSINISNMTVREEADIEKIATKLLEEIKKVDR